MGYVNLKYAFWQIDIPAAAVNTDEALRKFLHRSLPADSIKTDDVRVQNLINLMSSAGMVTVPRQGMFSLREVSRLFEPLCTVWQAQYYSHQLWRRLQVGALSKNAFIAWTLHNYHLSRSAGVTAARCATMCDRSDIADVFLQSTVEEYSHCEDYYLAVEPRLSLTRSAVENYVPLPSSLCFDQQMHYLAENDWLAHVLTGYFQESTAAYYKQCCTFYDGVEDKYSLPGFFDGWKGHIRLDHEYGHSSAFLEPLQSDELIASEALLRSLTNVRYTAQFLLNALDEVVNEERADGSVALRMPLGPGKMSSFDGKTESAFSSTVAVCEFTSEITAKELVEACILAPSVCAVTGTDCDFLNREIAYLFCRALSFATAHKEIIEIGRLVECQIDEVRNRNSQSHVYPSIWTAQISNFLRELVNKPALFVTAVYASGRMSDGSISPIFQHAGMLNALNELLGYYRFTRYELSQVYTMLAQWAEIFQQMGKTRDDLRIDIFSPIDG